MHKIDIHNFNHRLELAEARIQRPGIPKEDQVAILRFRNQCLAEGLGSARVVKYLQSLRVLYSLASCRISRASSQDIIEFLAWIEKSSWSTWTKHDHKLTLRKYLQFLGKEELAALIQLPKVHLYKLPEELLMPEEVQDILDAAWRSYDRALVAVLWETGARIGEILSLQRKHVQMDALRARILVQGKTGMRRVSILEAAPILDAWISELSPGLEDRVFPLSYVAASKHLKALAKRAGIKKRVYPHLFRHSRATYLAGYLTEAQLCAYLGWTIGSAMPRIYVHLAGLELDAALAKVPPLLHVRQVPAQPVNGRLPHV